MTVNYYSEAINNKDEIIPILNSTETITYTESFKGDLESQPEMLADKKEFKLEDLPAIEELEFGIPPEETVCIGDGDNRERATVTTNYPWRAICRLIITRADGEVGVGSGWFNGTGSVITAGHCVYSKELKKWHKSIVVVPGKDNNNEPYGRFISTNFLSVRGWVEQLKEEYDYGAILLENKIGGRVGYFGFRYDSDSEIKNKVIINSGYPAKPDKTGPLADTQWYTKGEMKKELLNERKIYYMLDTYGGNSGGPVWLDDELYRVICIHAYGRCPNSGTRINNEVFTNLLTWKRMGEKSTI